MKIRSMLLVMALWPAALAADDLVLKASTADGKQTLYECSTRQAPGKPRIGQEIVVIDRLVNHASTSCTMHWSESGFSFKTSLPAALVRDGKPVPSHRSQRWNTWRAVYEGIRGSVIATGDDGRTTVFAAMRFVLDMGRLAAIPEGEAVLYGELLEGSEKERELIACRSRARPAEEGTYFTYTVTTSLDRPVRFDWAGFTGTVEAGKRFSKSHVSRRPANEVVGSAKFTFADGSEHVITANYWDRRP